MLFLFFLFGFTFLSSSFIIRRYDDIYLIITQYNTMSLTKSLGKKMIPTDFLET